MKKKLTDLIPVGQLAGAHGVRGDVRIRSYTSEPEALFGYGTLYSKTGEPLLETVRKRPVKDHFIVTPDQPRQKEEWDALKGTRLYVPREVLPPTEEDEFYIQDLIGLEVYGGGDAALGRVKAVLNHGAGDLVEIQTQPGKATLLVPFTHIDIPTVDLNRGRIIVGDLTLWGDDET